MSYWNRNGKYQTQAIQIGDDVPEQGHAKLTTVELFRCASNVYYEIYNNGGCNFASEQAEEWTDSAKNVELKFLAVLGIDISKIEDLVYLMAEEYQRDSDMVEYDNSESEAFFKELTKEGGFMDQMMDSVIKKCKSLGYPFKEELED